jgi:uncharacterized protein YacL
MPRIWEMIYPALFSLIAGTVIFYSNLSLKRIENLDLILNSTVTISSIVIAFLGTMVSILISLTNEKVMKRIKDYGAQNTLTGYIAQSIITGLVLAVYSIILFMFLDYNGVWSNLLLAILAMLLCFFVFSSYRIMRVTSKILSTILKDRTLDSSEDKERLKPQINK